MAILPGRYMDEDLPRLIQYAITFSLGGSRKPVLLQDMAFLEPYSFEPGLMILAMCLVLTKGIIAVVNMEAYPKQRIWQNI